MRKDIRKIKVDADKRRYRRRLSIRTKVSGSSERPRICAFRSNKHLTVQVIDDTQGKTLFAVQTYGKNGLTEAKATKEGAKLVGEAVASKLKENKIDTAVFDRAGYKYTGIVATLIETIRESGVRV